MSMGTFGRGAETLTGARSPEVAVSADSVRANSNCICSMRSPKRSIGNLVARSLGPTWSPGRLVLLSGRSGRSPGPSFGAVVRSPGPFEQK